MGGLEFNLFTASGASTSFPGFLSYPWTGGTGPWEWGWGCLSQVSSIWTGRNFTSWRIWKGREICHFSLQKGPKGLTDAFYVCEKVDKRSGVVVYWYFEGAFNNNIDSYIAHFYPQCACLQQFKNMQSSTIGMLKEYHLTIEDIRKGHLFS